MSYKLQTAVKPFEENVFDEIQQFSENLFYIACICMTTWPVPLVGWSFFRFLCIITITACDTLTERLVGPT